MNQLILIKKRTIKNRIQNQNFRKMKKRVMTRKKKNRNLMTSIAFSELQVLF